MKNPNMSQIEAYKIVDNLASCINHIFDLKP